MSCIHPSFIHLRVIGLTGGIGTGKTTVSNYLLRHHKITILDADDFAHEAVSLGSAGLSALVQRYGSDVLLCDGTLNRAQLAQLIFQNSGEKRWVEALIHPYVRSRFESERHRLEPRSSILVMVIPLLFEAHMTDLVSEVWVVACRPDQQLQRLMQRNGLTEAEAQSRIDSQMPLAQKCSYADVVIENSDSLETLYPQIDRAISVAA